MDEWIHERILSSRVTQKQASGKVFHNWTQSFKSGTVPIKCTHCTVSEWNSNPTWNGHFVFKTTA